MNKLFIFSNYFPIFFQNTNKDLLKRLYLRNILQEKFSLTEQKSTENTDAHNIQLQHLNQ